MSLFRKIFGFKSEDKDEELKSNDRGKYMPEIKLPIDERFTINFKANGGKFLYCEDLNEIFQNLQSIIDENDWQDKKVLIIDQHLESKFGNSNLKTTNRASESSFFLTTCENLIANDGSLLTIWPSIAG